ncbi:MAG TPA: PepSY-associated TM helix domain-containing protein [Longimicrobiales bacterium]|nr:PepSY-associated TM helix domain-containing protein [Longimicrobiales bacterium]
MARSWRRWNAAIHRDLGYLCAGLTVVYAVSGVAVNHRADWNPNYVQGQETLRLEGLDLSSPSAPGFPESVLEKIGVEGRIRGTFRPDPGSIQIFVDDATVLVDLTTGEATFESVRPRPGLRQANFLHLNEAKKLWTWMADLYAVALLLLALTGLFILRGRNGITGRGAWLTAAGVAIPAVFLLLYL